MGRMALCFVVYDVAGEVPVADRLAGGEHAVTKQQERLSRLHPCHLAGQGFEIGRGADNGIAQAGLHERGFEGELGVLEGKLWFLHANGGEQNEVGCARVFCGFEDVEMCLMVNGPGVSRCTRA
jgi:hypothetical protein